MGVGTHVARSPERPITTLDVLDGNLTHDELSVAHCPLAGKRLGEFTIVMSTEIF